MPTVAMVLFRADLHDIDKAFATIQVQGKRLSEDLMASIDG
jgi:hypothetical protein